MVKEIIRIIAESELRKVCVAGIARKYGIAEYTLYRWRTKYKGLSTPEAGPSRPWKTRTGGKRSWWQKRNSLSRPWTRSLKKVLSPGQRRQLVRPILIKGG